MRKAFRWLLGIAGGVMLLALALYGIARLRGPSDEEKAALALLEESPPPPGQNAFAALWLLPYDVPKAKQASVLAEDVRRFAQTKPLPPDGEGVAVFTSIAEQRYHRRVEPDRTRYCSWRGEDCLAKVRLQRETYARLLEADAALLARADSISDYGHVRTAFPSRWDVPFPQYQYLKYPLTQHAYAFVSGNTDAALDGICRGISTSRMLIRHGDNLIASMVGAVMLDGNARLFADMLAELPAEYPLPGSCTAALTPPVPDEFSTCQAMRGEARFIFAGLQQVAEFPTEHAWQNQLAPIFYDADKTVARMAPPLAWYCGEDARVALAADVPTTAPLKSGSWSGCIDNFIGCVLVDAGTASFDDYQHRLQDAGIRLKAVSTLVWLRDNSGGASMAMRLARRPQALRDTRRELRIGEDGASLAVDMFDTRDGPHWRLPLPASRIPPARR